jgi:hypothetical protein
MERITWRALAPLLVTMAVGGGACGGGGDHRAQSGVDDVPPPSFPSCATTGGCLPDQQYCEDPGHYSVTDDIVTQSAAMLLWQRQNSALQMTYAEAAATCDGLVLSDLTHWRIPAIEELHGLVLRPSTIFGDHPGFCSPAIDQSAFPGTPADVFWSSTAVSAKAGLLYALNFADGRFSNWKSDPDQAYYVRCTHAASP